MFAKSKHKVDMIFSFHCSVSRKPDLKGIFCTKVFLGHGTPIGSL